MEVGNRKWKVGSGKCEVITRKEKVGNRKMGVGNIKREIGRGKYRVVLITGPPPKFSKYRIQCKLAQNFSKFQQS